MSDVRRYRRNPSVVEAMLFDGSVASATAIHAWISNDPLESPEKYVVSSIDISGGALTIVSHFGTTVVRLNNYVVKGSEGDFYPCPAETFAELYEEEI